MSEPIDNRRTFCDNCSLRCDLPGFITREHAQANADLIAGGQLFPCHSIKDPREVYTKNVCLGAALMSGRELARPPASDQTNVYQSLEQYVECQAAGRIPQEQLSDAAPDRWRDRHGTIWFGFWSQAPASNWRYLLTTWDGNKLGSAYRFFDDVEAARGPLQPCITVSNRDLGIPID